MTEDTHDEHDADPVHMVGEGYLLQLPRIPDPRGNLTFIEEERHVPFPVRRIYYVYDVPGGAQRAGHAHHELQQIAIAVSGSFDVLLDDGKTRRLVHLNRAYEGLLMPPNVWHEFLNFSSGAVGLMLASDYYDEADYMREYDDFLKQVGSTRGAVGEVYRDEGGQYTLW